MSFLTPISLFLLAPTANQSTASSSYKVSFKLIHVSPSSPLTYNFDSCLFHGNSFQTGLFAHTLPSYHPIKRVWSFHGPNLVLPCGGSSAGVAANSSSDPCTRALPRKRWKLFLLVSSLGLMTCFYRQNVISRGNDILGLLNPEVKSLASVFPHLGVSCHGKKFGPDNQMITDQLERQRISQPL